MGQRGRGTEPSHHIQLGDPVRSNLLKPLYKHMKQHILEQSVIHADETVVHVLKADGKSVTSESRMWVYVSGERSTTPIRLFVVGRKNRLFCCVVNLMYLY